MKNFKTLFEEIDNKLDNKLPEIKPPNVLNIGKRNANDQSKIAGKYLKGMDNITKPMVTQRDRNLNTNKGKIKQSLDNGIQNRTIVMSQVKFDNLLNTSGGRTMDLSDGNPKSINSKTANYTAQMLKDGRIQITKLRQ